MKIEKRDGGPERRIVTAMIVNADALSRIMAKWEKGGLFQNEWANTVGQWCVDHMLRYKRPPGKEIMTHYEAWAESAPAESVTLVERLLSSISDEYARLKKEINADIVLDIAGKHFNRVAAQKCIDRMQGHLDNDEVEKALAAKEGNSRIELGAGEWIDVLQDDAAMEKAYAAKGDPVVSMKGAVGEFFGDSLERDGFICLQAPEKRGKSFWLQEIGWQAMLQGRKVAMFQVGDLSVDQAMRRLGIRAARRPYAACEVSIPTRMVREGDGGDLQIDTKCKTWHERMSWEEAKIAIHKVASKTKTRSPLLKLSVHPNSSISMHGIADRLTRLARDGWTPDVVIIDYADILAPLDGKVEGREQINMSWKYMRRLSQEMHCLVLTASQTDADSYDTDLIRKRNFSEDKRKASHVTGTFSVNQTDDEKARGVYRLNWNFNRDNGLSENDVVHCAGSLAIANPCICSSW